MFFRNLKIYEITKEIPELRGLSDDLTHKLEPLLSERQARPCGRHELSTYGFIRPHGNDGAPLVRAVDGFLLIAAQKEERILPSSVVRDAVAAIVAEIEAKEGRRTGKKERSRIKEDVIFDLLPKTFTRRTVTFAAIDPCGDFIFIDTSSAKRAEELLSLLRDALGSLPVRPLSVASNPSNQFTAWVREGQDGAFSLGDSAVIREIHSSGKISATHEDLSTDDIRAHIESGKRVTQLALAWEDKLTFVIDDALSIKRLRFSDILHEQASEDGGDDADNHFDASFVLMMRTFQVFVPTLVDALGGSQ